MTFIINLNTFHLIYGRKTNFSPYSYKHLISEAFTNTFDENCIDNELEWFHSTLLTCSIKAYHQNKLTNKDQGFITKSWWTEDLTIAKKNLAYHFNQWKINGFQRDDDSVSYNRYKMSRKIFRKGIKLAQNNKLSKSFISLDNLKRTHPQKFWKNLKSLRKSSSRLFTINNKNNKHEITDEFADHFNNLLNTPRIINNNQKEFTPVSGNTVFLVSSNDVINALKAMHLGKSMDPFHILAEHLVYNESNDFISWFTDFYNHIFTSSIVPPLMSSSLIIPLVKSYKKSLSNPNNYRGISLIPVGPALSENL